MVLVEIVACRRAIWATRPFGITCRSFPSAPGQQWPERAPKSASGAAVAAAKLRIVRARLMIAADAEPWEWQQAGHLRLAVAAWPPSNEAAVVLSRRKEPAKRAAEHAASPKWLLF